MLRSSLVWLLLIAIAGCGGDGYRLAPVSGVVTLDGEPLPDARVSFEPRGEGSRLNAGPGSYATTDANGRYRMETIHGRRGAVVGTHDVTLSTFCATMDPSKDQVDVIIPERVPEPYRREGTLTFVVPPEGTDAADFQLTSP
jgi:hypothetical protein